MMAHLHDDRTGVPEMSAGDGREPKMGPDNEWSQDVASG
jgi:hypothetical protein